MAEKRIDILIAARAELQAIDAATRKIRELTKESSGGGPGGRGGGNRSQGAADRLADVVDTVGRLRAVVDVGRAAVAAYRGEWEGVRDVIFQLPFGIGRFSRSLYDALDELTAAFPAIGNALGVGGTSAAQLNKETADVLAGAGRIGDAAAQRRKAQEFAGDLLARFDAELSGDPDALRRDSIRKEFDALRKQLLDAREGLPINSELFRSLTDALNRSRQVESSRLDALTDARAEQFRAGLTGATRAGGAPRTAPGIGFGAGFTGAAATFQGAGAATVERSAQNIEQLVRAQLAEEQKQRDELRQIRDALQRAVQTNTPASTGNLFNP